MGYHFMNDAWIEILDVKGQGVWFDKPGRILIPPYFHLTSANFSRKYSKLHDRFKRLNRENEWIWLFSWFRKTFEFGKHLSQLSYTSACPFLKLKSYCLLWSVRAPQIVAPFTHSSREIVQISAMAHLRDINFVLLFCKYWAIHDQDGVWYKL